MAELERECARTALQHRRGLWMLVALAAVVPVVLLAPACVRRPPTSVDLGSLELVRVEHAHAWNSYDPLPPVARVFASGEVEIDGIALPVARKHEDLVAVLTPIAQRMPKRGGQPEEPLFLAADRRAPFKAVAALADACADPRVGIWKVALLVERPDPVAGRDLVGMLAYYTTASGTGTLQEFAADFVPAGRIDARADERGAARFSVGDAPCADRDQLAERLRSSGLDAFVLRATPELPWGALATLE